MKARMRLHRVLPFAVSLVAALAAPVAASAAPTITEFAAGNSPTSVARGADANVWFADNPKPAAVGRVTPTGSVTTYLAPTADSGPLGITSGPGGLWFTENAKNKIARSTTNGLIAEFPLGSHDKPVGITAGPDGNLWYTATGKGGAIGRMTPTGTVTEFTLGLTTNGSPQDITAGPDGNLWFTAPATGRIGRITPQGAIREYAVPTLFGTPQSITAGPDGSLWFTEQGLSPAIGRITTAGVITEYRAGLPPASEPLAITAGADGNIYFTDTGVNAIGQVTPSGAITMLGAGITAGADLRDITTGADGRLWFAEAGTAKVGRMTVAPTATTGGATAVTATTATVNGSITPNSQSTTYSFEWGTTPSYGQTSATVSAGSGAAAQAVGAGLTGLTPSTTYHARVVATNATGTTYGPDMAFTTTQPGAPTATSDPATAIDAAGATLNGLVNPENGATTYRFEWGVDTTYGNRVPAADTAVASDAADHQVSDILTGLAPNTTYHFRVVATSPSGTTNGADQAFTTDAVAPAAATMPATAVTAGGATLAGTVDPGNSATAYRFEWGLTAAYGNTAPVLDELVGSDHAVHPVGNDLAGLDPNTTYHFRVVATNNAGVTQGQDQTFTTAAVAPVATTAGTGAVTTTAASLKASVDPRLSATTYRFEWGPTTAYGQTTPATAVATDLAAHDVATDVTGLTPGTTYHFRIVAESAAGVTFGADGTFTTASVPQEAAPATAPGPPADAPGPPASAPADTPAAAPGPAAPLPAAPAPAPVPAQAHHPRPELGRTAVATVTRGTIRFRRPGSRTSVTVEDATTIPTGSVIDARNGTLVLENALDGSGHTQQATFRGAQFAFSLSRRDAGMVDVTLREAAPVCAARSRAAFRAAKGAKPKPVRSLWVKDKKGRYRTHGRNSVAIVRGTEWSTTETCAGTVTRVRTGAVLVKNLKTGRSVLLRAGRSYVARRAR
jgi:streptogramin lyase